MPDSLLLSLAGIIGTLIGSALTGFLALRSERTKQQALERHEERQSHRQASVQGFDLRLEHHRWRREHRRAAYQEFAERVLMARGAALDYHRCCLRSDALSENTVALRMEGRKAHRDAVMASYGVGLQGPEEVSSKAEECLSSLRDLLNCAEEHEARSSSGELPREAVVEMDERIDVRFNAVQEKLGRFIREGCATLERPTPPTLRPDER
ncbi:hypothetical protein [Streptomyces sp. NPDC026673]|uniref:hypothetical protein n=1 Tax=Streptomyces sp. NPDC026673 TaxID=3155724 RepID=UPI0033C26313